MNLRNLAYRGWIAAALLSAGLASHAMAQSYGPYDSGGAYGNDASLQPADPQRPAWNAGQNGYPVQQARLCSRSRTARASRPCRLRIAPPRLRPTGRASVPQPNEHPLMPAIRWAYAGLRAMDGIQDYSATLCKRERISGKLPRDGVHASSRSATSLSASTCTSWSRPACKGQEVIYVEGQNDGNMWATAPASEKSSAPCSLKPDGPIAMRGQRYPLTELGILNP